LADEAEAMLARVKLFGPMRLAVGQGELSLATEGDAITCAALRVEIRAREPRLAGLVDGCRFAVNGLFAGEEQLLVEGDEIALIGFVSGG
jgi:molybdopterin converting factor small subunit